MRTSNYDVINWHSHDIKIGHIDIKKWHIPDQSSDIHRMSQEVRNWRQLLTLTGPNSGRPQDVHWTSGIDVRWWLELDQISDIPRISPWCQSLTSVSDISWTMILTSPGYWWDVSLDLTKIGHSLMSRNVRCLLGCFLDCSEAFHLVNHSTLLHHLEHRLGITGPALNWLGSYSSGRTQNIAIGSSEFTAQSGWWHPPRLTRRA